MIKRKLRFLINSTVYVYFSIAVRVLKLLGLLRGKSFKSSFYRAGAHIYAETSSIFTIGIELLLLYNLLPNDITENLEFFIPWLFCFGTSFILNVTFSSRKNYFLKSFIPIQSRKKKNKVVLTVLVVIFLPIVFLMINEFW